MQLDLRLYGAECWAAEKLLHCKTIVHVAEMCLIRKYTIGNAGMLRNPWVTLIYEGGKKKERKRNAV